MKFTPHLKTLDSLTGSCPICISPMCQLVGGYSICKACGYMMSHEQPGDGAEVVSLEVVREKNFRFICKIIKEQFPQCNTVLDIGSATGLFLKVARDEGFSATGLEPDVHLAEETRMQGYDIINGFFPHAKGLSNRLYDILTFNDSLEHIPNLQEILQGIKDHLKKSGIVIVNVPSSDGILIKTAFFLYKLGMYTCFNRLMQRGFASPHLHCFNVRNLKQLFENNGFIMRYASPRPFYTIKGLWRRIRCKSSLFVSVFAWLGMVLVYPISYFHSDCFIAFFTFLDEEKGSMNNKGT